MLRKFVLHFNTGCYCCPLVEEVMISYQIVADQVYHLINIYFELLMMRSHNTTTKRNPTPINNKQNFTKTALSTTEVHYTQTNNKHYSHHKEQYFSKLNNLPHQYLQSKIQR